MYYIAENGFSFLAMGFRGKKADAFKEAYINQFSQMRNVLMNQSNMQWVESRNNGKAIRRAETDVIRDFVEYAQKQGSNNATHYYNIVTKRTNKALKVSNRDNLSQDALLKLQLLENTAKEALNNGMLSGANYKDVYGHVKKVLNALADSLNTVSRYQLGA